jgi:hypothetical protein
LNAALIEILHLRILSNILPNSESNVFNNSWQINCKRTEFVKAMQKNEQVDNLALAANQNQIK